MAFKSLVSAVSVQCQEIKQALASISYFDTWDTQVVAECCRVSSVAEYPADTIILGPGTGTSHTVYFILEGNCRMVQALLVEVNSRKELRKLYRFIDSKTSHSKSTNEGYSSRLFNEKQVNKEVKMSNDEEQGNGQVDSNSEMERKEDPDEVKTTKTEDLEEATYTKTEVLQEEISANTEVLEEEISMKPEIPEEVSTEVEVLEEVISTKTEMPDPEESEIPKTVDDDGLTEQIEVETEVEEKKVEDSTEPEKVQSGSEDMKSSEESEPAVTTFEPDHHLKVLEECKRRGKEATGVCKKADLPERPKHVDCFFVQTGFLNKGACFGLEKCQKENFIVSTVKVKCLKIPRRFLSKHNPCYTWNRIRLFHSLYLPKDEELLERIRTDRKWIRGREKLSEEIVSWRSIPNYTQINEVPYSIRLSEVLP